MKNAKNRPVWAYQLLRNLGIDTHLIHSAIADIHAARQSFAEDEYSEEEHQERLKAAYAIADYEAQADVRKIMRDVRSMTVIIRDYIHGHVDMAIDRHQRIAELLNEIDHLISPVRPISELWHLGDIEHANISAWDPESYDTHLDAAEHGALYGASNASDGYTATLDRVEGYLDAAKVLGRRIAVYVVADGKEFAGELTY